MGLIAERNGLLPILKTFTQTKPTWGTCAGMILLAKSILHAKEGGQPLLGVLDCVVDRNYFGSQVNSFEIDLNIPELGEDPFHAIFIRAPVIVEKGKDSKAVVLAQLSEKEIVALRQENILVTAFHPELSEDKRWHQYFVSMVRKCNPKPETKLKLSM